MLLLDHTLIAPPLKIATIFAALPLDRQQCADLLESLRFNGYIDKDDHYVDKPALARLPLDDLGLAVQFYPYRSAVLDAMRAQLQAQVTAMRSAAATPNGRKALESTCDRLRSSSKGCP